MLFNYKNNGQSLLFALCLLGAAFSVISCKKLVDVGAPRTTVTTEEVFTSDALANEVLAGIYSSMINGSLRFSNGGATVYAGLSADELANFAGTGNVSDYQFFTNTLLAANFSGYTLFWQPAYKDIYNANGAIAGIAASTSPALDDSTRRQLTGEALFIRAFCYFYLTNLFGDVPLVLSTDFNQTALMKRTPQADVYKQMIQDLKDAQNLLAANYSAGLGERIRPNKWAATALLARVYLYQQDWSDAEAQADSVIGNSQYSLVSNLNNVFLSNSQEAIWQLQQNSTIAPYTATPEGAVLTPLLRWSTLGPADQATFQIPSLFTYYAAYLIPSYYFSSSFMNVFEPGDKRRSIWTDSVPSPQAAPYNGNVYYFPSKYTLHLGNAGGVSPQYYMMLRLAELYLIRAEARAQQGNNLSGAADDLNALRTRAGLGNTTAVSQTDLLTAIAHERQVELFAEWGHRWLDLKRTGQASAVLGAIATKQPWSANALLYPIPAQEIVNDPNLVQNQGY